MLLNPIVFTLCFAALLVLATMVQFYLLGRQIRHVHANRHTVPASLASSIDTDSHRKAADYTVAKARLALVDTGLGAVTVAAWTLLGGLDLLNRLLTDALGVGMAQQLALLIAFTLIGAVIGLPLSWYQTFRLEEQFGFNRMNLKDWIMDGMKGALVSALLGLPLAAAVLYLMGHIGSGWWWWAWCVFMGFNLLMMVIYPTLIAPIFNRFTPLADESLAARANALMARCGFKADGFFVMDGSRRSSHANAYFTGLGKAKRVVFFDTLLTQLSQDEVEAVLAHELGHFHHRHLVKRIAVMAVVSLLALGALGWLAGQAWFYQGLGVEPNLAGANDALALLLFGMLVPQVAFWVSPWMATQSRRHEFEADAFAASHARASDLGNALLKLTRDNASTLTPDPLYVWFHYSHPPTVQRLAHLEAKV